MKRKVAPLIPALFLYCTGEGGESRKPVRDNLERRLRPGKDP